MTSLKRISLLFAFCSLTFFIYSCSDSSTGPDGDSGSNFDSQQGPGNSAELFLKGDQYSNLQVEIDYMPGHEPTQEGLDSLKAFLEKRLNKSSISFRSPTEITPRNKSSYTAADVRSIEEGERDFYTTGDESTLEVYFLVVDGEYEQSNVLGIAYWNTSVAFFGPTIESISGSPPLAPSEEKIESTVFRHEFGHNIGLVDNGSPMQTDHKTSGSTHCTTDGCLMEPSVRTTDFFSNFSGNVPPLKSACVTDLQANGGK